MNAEHKDEVRPIEKRECDETVDSIYSMMKEMDSRISSLWSTVDDLDTRMQNIEHKLRNIK